MTTMFYADTIFVACFRKLFIKKRKDKIKASMFHVEFEVDYHTSL
jgi:hypothetical protein